MRWQPVRDVRDGVVAAYDPPRRGVMVASTGAIHEVYVGATAALGREDIIVRRAHLSGAQRLTVILGPEGHKPSPSWHLVDPERDTVLATVRMPPNTSTVIGPYIVDHRSFGGPA